MAPFTRSQGQVALHIHRKRGARCAGPSLRLRPSLTLRFAAELLLLNSQFPSLVNDASSKRLGPASSQVRVFFYTYDSRLTPTSSHRLLNLYDCGRYMSCPVCEVWLTLRAKIISRLVHICIQQLGLNLDPFERSGSASIRAV